MTLASLVQQKHSVRAMALVLGRSPSSIRRELRRNAQPAGYDCCAARACALQRRRQSGPLNKLHRDGILFGLMRHFLGQRWSPEQIALELIATLRHAHNRRLPRSKGEDRRGQIPDMGSIHVRPPEIEDRQFSGHWEGDLIKGSVKASAVGTLVERTSRLLMLINLPEFKPASAVNVMQAFSDKLLGLAEPMRRSMTYDQGR